MNTPYNEFLKVILQAQLKLSIQIVKDLKDLDLDENWVNDETASGIRELLNASELINRALKLTERNMF